MPWVYAPAAPTLAGRATLKIGQDTRFLAPEGASRFLVLSGNPPPSNPSYLLGAKDFAWFAVFFYEDSGHVADDEKLDPAALLSTLRESNVKSNERRKELGYPQMKLIGWYVEPHYDADTKRLEWGLKYDSDGHDVVNYTSRILSREGIMHATLVSNPQEFEASLKAFRTAVAGFAFDRGQNYAEFKEGDKTAGYGLAALVVGGGAAVAAKSGAAKGLFKFLWIGLLAVAAGAKAIYSKVMSLFRRGE